MWLLNDNQLITARDWLVFVMGKIHATLIASSRSESDDFSLWCLAYLAATDNFFTSIFFCLSQSTPCGHNCIVTTAWDLARGKPLRTPVWRLSS